MTLQRALLIIGVLCLGIYIVFTVQAHLYQEKLEDSFETMVRQPVSPTEAGNREYREGDLVGRLEIPRLQLSVMVLEGIQSRTLRLGAGHIPGTPLPGTGSNAGIAAHRDTFFRPLAEIRPNDHIQVQTLGKTVSYRVVETKIVQPEDVSVLKATGKESITLVTCYPFYYVGPAPQRFIVRAQADSENETTRR